MLDISIPLDGSTPTWPGSPGFDTGELLSMEKGDPANVSSLTLDVHTGTHVDAPRHFLPHGSTVESLDLGAMVGPVFIVDSGAALAVNADILERASVPEGTTRLLLRTLNSTERDRRPAPFREDFVALTADGAQWVVDRGIRLVGIDYLSIQRFTDPADTHEILLEAGVVILEGLDLVNADPAETYELICLPVLLAGAEAAPARALLRRIPS